jgi:hypothetical protein
MHTKIMELLEAVLSMRLIQGRLGTVKYGSKSHGTPNQEQLCWKEPTIIYLIE